MIVIATAKNTALQLGLKLCGIETATDPQRRRLVQRPDVTGVMNFR